MFNMSLWIVCFHCCLHSYLDLLLPYLSLPVPLCVSSASSLLTLAAPTPTHFHHTISHTPPHLPHQLHEKNSRAANKSLEAALDSYNLTDVNLTPKAIEHYQLLDKQEKERQEFLEGMVEMLRAPERAEEKIVKEVMGMGDEMLVKRDVWDDEEVERDVVMEDEVDEVDETLE